MPYIDWTKLPKAVRQHLAQRVKERSLTEDDLILLWNWRNLNVEVPDGPWCKDFGNFTLAGEGAIPKTVLLKGMPCRGTRIS